MHGPRKAIPPLRGARVGSQIGDLSYALGAGDLAAERARFEAAYTRANGAPSEGSRADDATATTGWGVVVPSGREGLRIVLETLVRREKRRVVLPAYLDTSLLETVAKVGGEPLYCDVRSSDGTLDPDRLADVLGPGVAAVVVIHMFGRPAALASIHAVASHHGIPVIEDCAHAPSKPFAHRDSSLSLASFTSFAPFKLVDCGGGGGVHTTDASLAAIVRERAHASTASTRTARSSREESDLRAEPPALHGRHERHEPRVPHELHELHEHGGFTESSAVTTFTRMLGAMVTRAATGPWLYDHVGHPIFRGLTARGGAMPFYKRYVRPFLKRGADDETPPLPGALFLRAGCDQFASLPTRLAQRRRRAKALAAALPPGAVLAAELPEVSSEYAQVALFDDRHVALARLTRLGVDAMPAPMIARGDLRDTPVARSLASRAVQLPWFDGMTDEDVERIGRAVLDALPPRRAPQR